MAQQARPKVAGQIEDRRAQFTVQFTMLSSLVSRTPRSTSAASSAVTPGTAKTSVLIPRPLQAAKKPGFAQAAQKGPDARSARRDATPILRMGARRATAPEADMQTGDRRVRPRLGLRHGTPLASRDVPGERGRLSSCIWNLGFFPND